MFGTSSSYRPSPFGPVAPLGAPESIGGVPGVSVVPITSVQLPAAPGGPHALPNLPQFPLPQGIPNPFELQQLTLPAQAQSLPTGPGITYTTGPNNPVPGTTVPAPGYNPVHHQFPTSTAGAPTFAPASAYQPSSPPQWLDTPQTPVSQWPVVPSSPLTQWPAGPQIAMPQWPGPSQVPAHAPAPSPAAQTPHPAEVSTFWVNLGWQLLLTPTGRKALGERYTALMEGPNRQRTLRLAAECLIKDSLQTAYRDLTVGTMTQNQFIDLFSAELAEAVKAIEI